ncbi:MAG: hypothetical protein KDA37_08425 [Planctomycetales bacterium]|nr:hypothetical protein [Planctomycetales bacterium]
MPGAFQPDSPKRRLSILSEAIHARQGDLRMNSENPYKSPQQASPHKTSWPRLYLSVEVACWASCVLMMLLLFVWWLAEHVLGIGIHDVKVGTAELDAEHVRYALAIVLGTEFFSAFYLMQKRMAASKARSE